MRTYINIKRKGYRAGQLAVLSGEPQPCPYRQWPLSALRKYRAFLEAYFEGKSDMTQELEGDTWTGYSGGH